MCAHIGHGVPKNPILVKFLNSCDKINQEKLCAKHSIVPQWHMRVTQILPYQAIY